MMYEPGFRRTNLLLSAPNPSFEILIWCRPDDQIESYPLRERSRDHIIVQDHPAVLTNIFDRHDRKKFYCHKGALQNYVIHFLPLLRVPTYPHPQM